MKSPIVRAFLPSCTTESDFRARIGLACHPRTHCIQPSSAECQRSSSNPKGERHRCGYDGKCYFLTSGFCGGGGGNSDNSHKNNSSSNVPFNEQCTVFQLQCRSRSFYDGQTAFSPYMSSDYKLLQVSGIRGQHYGIHACILL